MPEEFATLRRLLEARMGKQGKRGFVQVLCRIERRPPRLDMTAYPYLPRAHVAATSARTYLDLLAGTAS